MEKERRRNGLHFFHQEPSRVVPSRNSRRGAGAGAIPCRNLRHLRDRGPRTVYSKLRQPRVSFRTVIYDTWRGPRVIPYRYLRHLGRTGCHSVPLFTADGQDRVAFRIVVYDTSYIFDISYRRSLQASRCRFLPPCAALGKDRRISLRE